MKRFIIMMYAVAFVAVSCSGGGGRPAVIPSPVSVEVGKGSFAFTYDTVISVEDDVQREIADRFAWLFARPAGFVPQVRVNADDADVVLHCDPGMTAESYRIDVGRKKILIEASDLSGFFYAFQTLRQVLPAHIGSDSHADGQIWTVPVMTLYDVPRFGHRCIKLNVTEHFIPLQELFAFVEYMSLLKLNHLHLFGYEEYTDEDRDMLMSHASEFHVNVVCENGHDVPLYACPDDIVSRIFPSVAALAEVAWSEKEVVDKIRFNKAVDALDDCLSKTVLGHSKSVYDIGLAALR